MQYIEGWDGAHGTHVAGSVLGNGTRSNGQIKGAAYEASLIFQSVMDSEGSLGGLPDDLNELFRQAYDDESGKPGARIHSNSWGSDVQGRYTIRSQDVDEFTFAHPDLLVVFSAGNAGIDANGDGIVDLNSLDAPASAKNCLTVGASENQRTTGGYSEQSWGNLWPDDFKAAPIKDDYPSRPKDGTHQGIVAFSSRGPCEDGRIKPDIVAPGTDILSTKVTGWPDDWVDMAYWGDYNSYYAYMGGTSMATPLTSGAAALVRQWLVRDVGLTNPDGATVKALMLAGAQSLFPGQYGTGSYQEIPKAYPNNVEGWGQVNLGQTVKNANGIVVRDAMVIEEGATDTYTVTVPMAGALNIVMAYTDAPGSTSAAKTLVNDLDLLVTGPDGRTYYPNSGTSPDRVNNVEGVRFDAAEAGDYVITVTAHSITTPMSTSLTGGKSDAVRYSLAVIGAKSKEDAPTGDKPDLRPWTVVDSNRGWTWSAPLVLQRDVWDTGAPCNLVGKTQFSVEDEIYVNWAAANFSSTAEVHETFQTAILVDGAVGTDQESGEDLLWNVDGLETLQGVWSANTYIGKLPVGMHKITLVVDYDDVVDRLQPDQNTYEVTIEVTADGPAPEPGELQYGLGKVSMIGDFPDSRVSSTIVGISGLDIDNIKSLFDMKDYPYVLTDQHIVDAEKLSGRQVDYTWCQQLTDVDLLTFTEHVSAYGYDNEDDFADYLREDPSRASGDLVAEALSKEGPSAELCRTWIQSDYSKFADALEENLAGGEAMASIGIDFGDVIHVMAVCGYAIDRGYRPNDPDRLVGLYCIDPDDDKRGDVRAAANQIRFYYVYWDADLQTYFMSRDYTWEGKSYEEGVILCDEELGLGYVLRAKEQTGTVTVEFDANGGECATKSQNYTIGSKYGTLPRATMGETMFMGWYTKLTGGKRVNAVSTVSSDVTCLYARWQEEGEQGPQVVSIAFGAAAGSASSPEIENDGTKVTFKKVMFPTWVTAAKLHHSDGEETDVYKGLVKVDWDGDATLELTAEANDEAVARTDKLVLNCSDDNTKVFCTVNISQAAAGGEGSGSYKIVFMPGEGGTGRMDSMQAMTGETFKLPKCIFSNRDGTRSFAGWKSDAGKAYKDEAEVRDLAKAGETVTLTAQWGAAPFTPPSIGLADDEKEGVILGFTAYTYDGCLIATNEDNSVIGVVTVKVDKKGKTTATVTRIGEKKLTYKSQMPIAKGEVDLVCTKSPDPMHLTVYAGGIEGSCGAYQVSCRKNVAKEKPFDYLRIQGKVWAVALKTDDFDVPGTMVGYASLTVTVSKNGKTKVSGLLPDGTKVSVSTQAEIHSDGTIVIPVVAQLYSGKVGGISLALQIDGETGEAEVRGAGKWKSLSGYISWDASLSHCEPVNVFGITRKTDMFVLEEQPTQIGGMNVATQFLHSVSNMMFMGKKWMIAKGGKIKLMGADFVDQAASPNPGGLTLSYTPKTGAFKGKYAVYVNNFGKSKKLSATINGVVVGESGYGTAVIKNQRSIPVRVEEQKK